MAYLELPNFTKGGNNWFYSTGTRAPDGLSLVFENLSSLTPTTNLSATYIYAPKWNPTGSFPVGVLNNPKMVRLYMPSVSLSTFFPTTVNSTLLRDRLVEVDLSKLPSIRYTSNAKIFKYTYAPNLKRVSLSADGDFYESAYRNVRPYFGGELVEFVNKAPATYAYFYSTTEAHGAPFALCTKLKRAVINIKLRPTYNCDVSELFLENFS